MSFMPNNAAAAPVAPGAAEMPAADALKASAQMSTEEVTHYLDIVSPYIGVFLLAWLVAIVLTPVMRKIAVRFGVVDQPDLDRKLHLEPVAYLGGVAIFLAWLSGIGICYLFEWDNNNIARYGFTYVPFPPSIIAGAAIITLVGLIDDIKRISPRVKIGGQLFGAAMLAYNDLGTKLMTDVLSATGLANPDVAQQLGGLVGADFGSMTLAYILGTAVIAIFVLGACNAVNLLDGLDGLVAGSLSISYLGFLVIAGYVAIELTRTNGSATQMDLLTDPVRLAMCMAVLGALLGFLPHNFNPASIFMGDAGSLLLGYLCATTILLFAHSMEKGPVIVTAALVVFALPITDTALAIFRRVMARKPIFSPDNQHLHHHMVRTFSRMGAGPLLSVKLAVISMYALSALFAALGCSLVFVRWRVGLAVFAVIFGFVTVIAYKAAHRHLMINKAIETDKAAALATPAPAPQTPPHASPGLGSARPGRVP